MNIAKVLNLDIANGPGVRTSVFVSGCRRHCKGCFNEVAWDFNYGKTMDAEMFRTIFESLREPNVEGLTILGGEPFEKENLWGVLALAEVAQELKKSVWVYTGYTLEELLMSEEILMVMNILTRVDVLVDGPFIEEEKDISLRFRGSRNQRIIDLPLTLGTRCIVLADAFI